MVRSCGPAAAARRRAVGRPLLVHPHSVVTGPGLQRRVLSGAAVCATVQRVRRPLPERTFSRVSVPMVSPCSPRNRQVVTPPEAVMVMMVAVRRWRYRSAHRTKERMPFLRAARETGTPPGGSSRSAWATTRGAPVPAPVPASAYLTSCSTSCGSALGAVPRRSVALTGAPLMSVRTGAGPSPGRERKVAGFKRCPGGEPDCEVEAEGQEWQQRRPRGRGIPAEGNCLTWTLPVRTPGLDSVRGYGPRGPRRRPLLLPVLLLVLLGCGGSPDSDAEQYRKGYRYAQGAPAAHVGIPAAGESTAGAEAECGEHAETDGAEPFPPSRAWRAGRVDSARGRPAAPPEDQRR